MLVTKNTILNFLPYCIFKAKYRNKYIRKIFEMKIEQFFGKNVPLKTCSSTDSFVTDFLEIINHSNPLYLKK